MENTIEKLENIEQILELLISEVKSNNGTLIKEVGANIKDVQNTLLDRLTIVENLPSKDFLGDLKNNLGDVSGKLTDMPEVFKVRHQHRIEVKNKFQAIFIFCSILVVIISISGSIFLISKNLELRSGSDKFLVVQGAYPKLAMEISDLYDKEPERLLDSARKQISERQYLLQAITREKEAKLEYEKAKQSKNKLKGATR